MTYQKAISAIMDACNWNGSGQYTSDELTEAKRIVCEATEKQIPKKPIDKTLEYDGYYGRCPDCKRVIYDYRNRKRCHNCGQALDWSDTE
jgi:hypothetical protein